MRIPLLLALASLVLAGCVNPEGVAPAGVSLPADADAVPRLVAHTADALVPLPDAWSMVDVRLATTGESGPEPTLGVLGDGTLFAAVGNGRVARSVDHGRVWEILDSGDLLTRPKQNFDPWIWVDPATDRVYNGPLYVVCTWLTWSDDAGATWQNNPLAGCGVPAHDHQKITGGPPAAGVTTNGYPSVLYYSYNSFRGEGTWISTSLDGGKTWDVGQAVHEPSECQSGVAGPVAVGPTGIAYSPKPTCDGIQVAVSKDSGKTWSKPVAINGAGMDAALASMTDAAVDEAGNAYVAWVGKDGRAYFASTTDGGATWSAPKAVSPPGVNATVFPVITAGADGRVAVAYLGTRADTSGWDSKSAEFASRIAVWHLFLSFAEAATQEAPALVTVQATPEDDPVQIGCIWQSGGANPCRNMADFMDMVERDGRVYVVFADGCKKCVSADRSRASEVTLAIVERGPSLRDPTVQLAPLPSR